MHLDYLEGFTGQDKDAFGKTMELVRNYWSYKTPPNYIEWSDLFIVTQPAFELANKLRKEYSTTKDIEKLYALPYFLFLLPKNFKSICNLPEQAGFDLNFKAAFVACLPDQILVAYLSKTTACYGSYQWSDPFGKDDVECKTEDFILEKFMKNLILTLTYESKYVTEESIKPSTKGKGFNSNATTKPFQVRWLGKNYTQIKHSVANKQDQDLINGKRIVRAHWRRGHWHTVCCGPKHKQRKQQWFKPVFVNAA